MSEAGTRQARTRWTWAAVGVALVIGALAGAWLDWEWWEPYNGIVFTLAGVGLLVAALIAWALRHPVARSIGLVVGALGVGLLLGQNFGPAREMPDASDGTITLRLTSPAASEATAAATCSSTSDGLNLWVTTEGDMRITAGDEYAVRASFAMGDMWRPAYARDDGLEVSIQATDTGPIAEDGAPTEVAMISDRSSTVTADIDGLAGTVEFGGLVRNERYETGVGQAEPIDFAGTIEFSCEAPAARP